MICAASDSRQRTVPGTREIGIGSVQERGELNQGRVRQRATASGKALAVVRLRLPPLILTPPIRLAMSGGKQ